MNKKRKQARERKKQRNSARAPSRTAANELSKTGNVSRGTRLGGCLSILMPEFLFQPPRRAREDRHILIAMVLASLVAGLFFLINFDRSTHEAAALKMGKGTSLHGWPWVYLHREYSSLTSYLVAKRINPWPIPVVDEETRVMNYQNLALDFLVCGTLVIFSYFAVRTIVFRYDRWKNKGP